MNTELSNHDNVLAGSELANNILKVSAWRQRNITYWGNNNQYEKETICASSSLSIACTEEDYQTKNEALLTYLNNAVKKAIDEQEKLLPKPIKGEGQ